jgi:hypothetical protein
LILIASLFFLQNNSLAQDTLKVEKPVKKEFKAEPHRATMLAIALPGLGQIYNRKYWKVPVVYVGFGAILYAANYNGSRYNTHLKAYQDLTDAFPETRSYLELKGLEEVDPDDFDQYLNPSSYSWYKDRILRSVDYYRKYRDLSYIGIALWYMVSILDANVDASLFNYDVSDDLDIEIGPVQVPLEGQVTQGLGVTMRVTF